MSDYLTRLIQRSVHFGVGVQPRVAPLFAPLPDLLEPTSEPHSNPAPVDGGSDSAVSSQPSEVSSVNSVLLHAPNEFSAVSRQRSAVGSVNSESFDVPSALPIATQIKGKHMRAGDQSFDVPSALPIATQIKGKHMRAGDQSFDVPSALPIATLRSTDRIPSTLTSSADSGEKLSQVIVPPIPSSITASVQPSELSAVSGQRSAKMPSNLLDNTNNGEEQSQVIAPPFMLKRTSVQPRASFNAKPITRTGPSAMEEQTPTIRIHIGRIDVRAMLPSSSQVSKSRQAPVRPSLSLDDYLKKRNEGRQ